jgi:type II secretory pathway predicted ATPase ExeA
MYDRFYGFRVKPFALLPQEQFMFLSRQHRMALALLSYSLHNSAMFCVVCGDIGTGKTTLLRYLLTKHAPHIVVGMITSTTGTFFELLQWMMSAFGLDYHGREKIEMQQELVAYLKRLEMLNKRAVLVIDEAQALSPQVLEELRLFSNVNAGNTVLLQTVLVGQLSLRETLRHPDMRQLAQRVAVDYQLTPLDKDQTQAYVRHRLRLAGGREDLFTTDACDAVFSASSGIPRVVNLLCDTALTYGYADQKATIDVDVVAEMLQNSADMCARASVLSSPVSGTKLPRPRSVNKSSGAASTSRKRKASTSTP